MYRQPPCEAVSWNVNTYNFMSIPLSQPPCEAVSWNKEEYIKIVYDGLIENCYIDLKQLNKIKKFIKKNEYEYIGLFFEDIEPVIEVMKYLNENSKAINELLYTSIDLQEGGD